MSLPDGATIQSAFTIEDGRFLSITTDPEGLITETLTNERGQVVELRKKDRDGSLLMRTRYTYDALGSLLTAVLRDEQASSGDFITRFTYDLRGLQTAAESPDTGLTELTYDEVGSLIEKVDENLRAAGDAIRYEYDGLGRLILTDYPDMEDVSYQYGASGAGNNAAGRLVSRSDESGSIRYEYGLMGEITLEEKTLKRLSPLSSPRSAVIEYESDYLGRMQSVTYPDGEVIAYDYDQGGQVTRVTGTRSGGTETVFVERIGYDEFGQRSFLEYGNGDVTTYEYDPERRWLENLRTENTYGRIHQNLSYDFDLVGNITNRLDETSRYESEQSYSYDGMNQLTAAEGSYTNHPQGITDWRDNYTQGFTYDGLGNMTNKDSTQTRSPSNGIGALNYSLAYEYDPQRPHQATRIGELYYGYDPGGNLTEESEIPIGQSGAGELPNLTREGDVRIADQGFGLVNNPGGNESDPYRRTFVWDEENRLKIVQAPDSATEFLYDASGERTVKYSGSGETLYYNSWWTETTDWPGFRRSKHIYLGSERIVTRLSMEGVGTGYEDVNTYYYHPDHLGSVHSVTDVNGDAYERLEYTPFGEMWVEIREDNDTAHLNYIPFRFTAKEWDGETGLYYYGARYYEPKLSRWMSADPAGFNLINPMDGEGKARSGYSVVEATGWYGYVSNNPVRYVDPTGLSGIKDEIGPPKWEDRYDDYAAYIKGLVRDRNPQESEDFYTNIDPASDFLQGELDQLHSALGYANDNLRAKRDEVYDLLSNYRNALEGADSSEREFVANLIPIPGSPEGKSGYELTEYIIPESICAYSDIIAIPGKIDTAVGEYQSLFRSKDSVETKYIQQAKAKWQ